jgi:histidine triad (HIT) family protein
MASVFTKIMNGEIPGRFVWKDEQVTAFLTIAPINPGHVLVVPREEIDHWTDLPDDLVAHLMTVAKTIGAALRDEFEQARIGVIVAGLEVPHAHVHLIPFDVEPELSFARANADVEPGELDHVAERIRTRLTTSGFDQASQTA